MATKPPSPTTKWMIDALSKVPTATKKTKVEKNTISSKKPEAKTISKPKAVKPKIERPMLRRTQGVVKVKESWFEEIAKKNNKIKR